MTKYHLQQLICWILLLQLANISIDPPEIKTAVQSLSVAKHKNDINKIESIYELVAEGLLEKDVPESEEQDVEKTIKSIELYCYKPALQTFEIINPPLQHQVYYPERFPLQYTEPLSPPPKIA